MILEPQHQRGLQSIFVWYHIIWTRHAIKFGLSLSNIIQFTFNRAVPLLFASPHQRWQYLFLLLPLRSARKPNGMGSIAFPFSCIPCSTRVHTHFYDSVKKTKYSHFTNIHIYRDYGGWIWHATYSVFLQSEHVEWGKLDVCNAELLSAAAPTAAIALIAPTADVVVVAFVIFLIIPQLEVFHRCFDGFFF